ncbi:MAG: right-handed parallel beta-helix repeat-containing protein [Verrucomicrobia bacterium]|nr:right-handed parallel beta-helix repeat-containing protein [Verrucomicrobiota bacterium]
MLNTLQLGHRLILQAVALLALLGFTISARGDFFVAPNGTDANPGSKAKPFASLERARDAVRELKRENKMPKRGLTIWLRGGDYVRTNALELLTEDSGTAQAPIVWRAYRSERVRLLGGRKLTGFEPVTNAAVLARLDEKARGRVFQLDLRALGITDFGEMKSRGFGRPTTPAHCELFYDGKPMTLARWPNEGAWEKIAGFPDIAGKGDDHGGKIGDLPGGFFYGGDRPRRWRNTNDIWVHGYWAWDWANSYERVASLDPEQHFIKTAAPFGLYGFRKSQRFHFLNVLEELDQPGEWFLDRTTGVLYFWPPTIKGLIVNRRLGTDGICRNSEVWRQGETIFSALDQPLLKLTSVSHVTFRGLTLEATRGNAVEIRGGASNRVAGCVIRNIGNSAVTIDGGRGHGVVSCDIFDTGDGGVSLSGGDRQTLTPAAHFVENCHFQRQGRWSKCYVPAVLLSGVGQRVSHNLIHDHPHCAILFTGNDHLIEFNDIHHIALETGDVGAIYTGRDYTFRGNKIRHNFIHETGGIGMGSMGVYMDDCVSGTEVFGNVFYKVHWAMFIGGGRDHRVENNIFVDCDPAIRADGRGLDKSPVWRGMVDDFMRQQLGAVPLALYREHYPAMKALDRYYGPPGGPAIRGAEFKGVPPEGNVIVRNVCAGKWLDAGWNATKESLELRDNLTDAGPQFVSREKMDFRLKKNSPAWRTGFQPIPFEKIGLHADEFRRELKRHQVAP